MRKTKAMKEVSNCHGASLMVVGSAGETNYYQCSFCGRACDVRHQDIQEKYIIDNIDMANFLETDNQISLCKSCHCMTHTFKGKCGKCGKKKS
jgi:DNA-directed RNA polymerase subunit M/transcription elongation factor TFIIS